VGMNGYEFKAGIFYLHAGFSYNWRIKGILTKSSSSGQRGELRSLYVGKVVCCYIEKGNIFAFNLTCLLVFEMTTLEITSKQFL
jgi:hypothetical protein